MAAIAALCTAGAISAGVAPAAALSDGLHFSANDESTWQTNGTVWALAASQGTIFAGGTFTSLTPPAGESGNAVSVTSLASFDAATGKPTSCRPTLYSSVGSTTVRALAVSPDKKTLYIGGHFTHVNGTPVARLAAIDIATCTLKAFRTPSIAAIVRSVAVTEDSVYFAGDFNTVSGQERGKFAAVDANSGALLPWTVNADRPGRAVAVSADENKVAVGGDFFTVNGSNVHSAAVVDAHDGSLLRGFGVGGNTSNEIPETSVTKTITSDATGFYVGNEGTGGGVFDGKLAIDYTTLDQRWRDLCLGANQALTVKDSTLYSANHSHDCSLMGWQTDGQRVFLQAQTTAAPTESIAWKPELNDGIGEGIGPRALTIGDRGGKSYLWVGGEFTRTNGTAQRGLTRFASGPASSAPSVPVKVSAESLESGKIQVRWRTSTDADDGRLTYRVYRDGSSTPLKTVTGDATWWHQPQVAYIDEDVVPGRSYSYRVTASDETTTTALSAAARATAVSEDVPYASRVLKDGANLYWRYNEQNDNFGADSSPGNKHLRYFDGPNFRAESNAVAGEPGYAIGFNGTGAYGLNDTFEPGPSEYSIETWFKTSTAKGGKLIGYGNGNAVTGSLKPRLSSNYDRQIYMTDAGRLVFGAYDNGTVALSSTEAYNDNEWHYVVATQGKAGMRLFVDGALVRQNGTTKSQEYTGTWHVGGDNLNGWPNQPSSNYFAGLIDETAIYPKALNALQVNGHYTAAGGVASIPESPKDAYGASVFKKTPDFFWRFDELADGKTPDAGILQNAGLLNGTASAIKDGVLGGAVDLGNDGYVSSAVAGAPSPEYTAELWFSTTSTSGGRLIGFSSSQSGSSSNYDRHVYMRDDGKLVFGTWTGSENTAVSPESYNDGGWHHLAASQSTDGMKLYVDGAVVASNPQTGAQSYNGQWRVGGDRVWGGASNDFLTGLHVDEAAVYSEALSAQEVASHHALGIGGAPPDLVSPTAPQDLTATANGNDVALTWKGSTDDTAVTGYTVYRSDNAEFTANESNQVAMTTTTRHTDTVAGTGTWYYQVIAHDAAGNTSPPAKTTVKITAPDTQSPSVVEDVRATVTEDSIQLGWSAATDDTSVDRYSVYRGDAGDFTPSAGSQIGETTDLEFTEKNVPVGAWFYKVIASDAAGNASPPSQPIRAVVEAPAPEASTVKLAPSGDAMVNQGAVNANYGSSNQLASRGSLGYVSYLKFELPKTPTGTHLSRARLSIRTTTSSFAGSQEAHQVRLGSNDWTENSITWGNRPELVGLPMGEFPAGTNPNTAYSIELATSGLTGVNGPATLAVTNLGTDNLWFWSTEQAAESYRPALELTYLPGNPTEEPPPAPSPKTVELTPTRDAMVSSASSSTNYGTVNQLASRTSPTQESFLSFDLPAAPAGTILSDVVLRIHTTTLESAGSSDEHGISAMEGAWDEAKLTYANRPSTKVGELGSIAGGTKNNTSYEVALDPESTEDLLGSDVTLRIGASSADSLWIWSRERTIDRHRPLLSLTFVPVQP
ncbi:LamG-like jellyroll fold domain-containing protein [Arthrobacter sp.]|uniref:LamG-like jellyroll fold domain-containing protein n=1 Tax=Arthrobacter sp. TaxID=1667 RepID=UPI003A93A0D0